ncbi:MAG: HAMP domain-containing histidine kinase [Clostridia bacterium]|nr:HAMP domain-containing histidine kinase [Clostridia bacterium]
MKRRKCDRGENRKKRIVFGIKGRIVLYFTAFVLLMLSLVWFMQIAMLDRFYRNTKTRELETVTSVLCEYAGTQELSEKAYNIAGNYQICVLVFESGKISKGSEIISVECSPFCLIHHLPDDVLLDYSSSAAEKGGVLLETVGMGSSVVTGRRHFTEKDVNITKVISVTHTEGADGKNYVIFADSEFTPVHSVEVLLSTQFAWLAAGIILLAVISAVIFALNISKPLESMNESAKKLAKGDYRPNFRVEGYRETRELAETLNYAAVEISVADRLRSELVANLSHDLRTPLTMISGYAEVMRDIPGENTPENIQTIIDETGHLTELVNDMLDLSKIESGSRKPVMTEFNLTAAVSEVMERYSHLKEHDGYTILFESDAEVTVFADRMMIIQTVCNLVNNAINYGGDRRYVKVSMRLFSGGSAFGFQPGTPLPQDTCVRVTVSDLGEGIAPENIRKIWDRYYKVDRMHRRATVGTGLGLSIVREILQLHGAEFGVESTPGEGSDFWFELKALSATEKA